MKFVFNKAQVSQARARMTIIGPSGAGKTYTALKLAQGLGSKIAVIDTENGSASKYADEFDFFVLRLEDFSPQNYAGAIEAAEEAGFDVIVIDSLSHAWMGKGGALELVNKAEKRYHGNSFAAWRDVTPLHNAMVDAIVRCNSHLIATMRSKTDYVIETDDKGRKIPRKVGLAPVQRDGIEYEFDIVADMDMEHNMIISKTRCRELDGAVFRRPGLDVAAIVNRWLSDPATPRVSEALTTPPERTSTVDLVAAEAPALESKPARRKAARQNAEPEAPSLHEDDLQAWREAALELKNTARRHFNGDHELVLEALKRKEGVSDSRAIGTERLLALARELDALAAEGEPSVRAQLLIWRQMTAPRDDGRHPSASTGGAQAGLLI